MRNSIWRWGGKPPFLYRICVSPPSRAPFSSSCGGAAPSGVVQPQPAHLLSPEAVLPGSECWGCYPMNHVSRGRRAKLFTCVRFDFFFSENSTENTHFSLQVWRFDKLSGKFERWKELLVRSTPKTIKKNKHDGLFIRNQASGRKGNDDIWEKKESLQERGCIHRLHCRF